jgi:anti-anti-sigma factor
MPAPPGAAGSVTLVATDASGRRCLELAGDLDLAGVERVRAELVRELAGGIPVTLDLTRLGFIASVGLGLLLELRSEPGRADLDVLLPTSGPARRVLDLAGLTGVLFEPGTDPGC